jgi:hypothetical protein
LGESSYQLSIDKDEVQRKAKLMTSKDYLEVQSIATKEEFEKFEKLFSIHQ